MGKIMTQIVECEISNLLPFYLIKRERSLSRAFSELEEKITKGALIDINCIRIFRGEACFLIRFNPRAVCLGL
jgi:hypothetical protein